MSSRARLGEGEPLTGARLPEPLCVASRLLRELLAAGDLLDMSDCQLYEGKATLKTLCGKREFAHRVQAARAPVHGLMTLA